MENVIGFKTTEKSVRLIEAENVIVLVVNRRARKPQLKKMFEETMKVKVAKINTLVKDNKKLAYIKLKKEYPAIDIATKFGLI